MPKISVIMGVYNPKNQLMLKEAVNSILNQSYCDFEFIICDDASNNDVKKWLTDIEKKDSRVKIISNNKNYGLAFSLNHCLKYSKGEFIARQDADDFSETDRFAKQIDFLERNNDFSMIGTNIKHFDDNGVYAKFSFPEFPQKKDFLFSSPFNHGSIMIRKSVIDNLGGYRTIKKTLRCEDYDLFMRLYSKGFKAYNIQSYLYRFREDRDAKRRRKYKYRIDEAKVRAEDFKLLGFGYERYFYIIKPLIVGIIPDFILTRLKKFHYKNRIN